MKTITNYSINSIKGLSFIIALFLTAGHAMAQSKGLSSAERFFSVKNYEQALPLFEEEVKNGNKEPMVHYKAGVCCIKSPDLNQQIKAIPYLEYAIKNEKSLPVSVHLDLADACLKNENLDKAKDSYQRYKELTKTDRTAQRKAEEGMKACETAKSFMRVPRKFIVKAMGSEINSNLTEYGPVVSADESVLSFTALRPNNGKAVTGNKFIEEIQISSNEAGNWAAPQVLNLNTDQNLGTAGISADGQKMYIFMSGVNDPGNLFQINKSAEGWSKPAVITGTMNSPAMETGASITPDGKTIYFSSDRPGGKGGLDIYRTTQTASGTWGAPQNLGSPINTDADEDAPFIHPDQKTLYFTSNGHKTMGGRDIFKSKLIENIWTKPENMGYPVNTTANDNYFSLLANGKRAYFSSDRKGGMGAQDIYYIDMPDESNVALTLIKGRILDAETGKPISTKMYVIDKQTDKKLDFVYSPDPTTGAYLVILPPAKNYDIVIESEGFLPYTLNINVPNQTYFYELFQLISLKTIKQFDVLVGQEVSVVNAFYDTKQDSKGAKPGDPKVTGANTAEAYEAMIELMSATDQKRIDNLINTIQTKNTVTQVNFKDKNNSQLETAARTYYYDESDESKFEKKQVDGQTILSLPTFYVTEEARKQKNMPKKKDMADKSMLNKVVKVYFDAGKNEVKAQYNPALDELLGYLNKHPELGIEISGFASAEGDEEKNRELSNKRAITVLEYFNYKGIVRRRVVAMGYGSTTVAESSKEEGRRVEVKLVELATQ
jgi:outer membrane protein OmpA-like peptidoglycan-associated protein